MDKIDAAHEKGYRQPGVVFSNKDKEKKDKEKVVVTYDKLHSVAYEVINLVMRKNADYGDAWQRQGIFTVCVRLVDKLCRVETLADGRDVLVSGEVLEDTLRDIIGYALLGLLYLREHGGE